MNKSSINYQLASTLLKNKGNRYSRPIINLSIIGIALGIIIMLLSIGITVGYKTEIRKRVIDMGGHIRISNYDFNYSYEPVPIEIDQINLAALSRNPDIKAVLFYSTKVGIIKTDDQVEGIVLKGVDSSFFHTGFANNIIEGKSIVYPNNKASQEIVISKKMSQKTNLAIGDKVRTYFVQDPPKQRSFTIVGIYETGLPEYDDLFAIVDLRQVQKLNNWDSSSVGGVEILLSDFDKMDQTTSFVNKNIGYKLKAETIKQIYPQIFEWIALFDTNVIVLIIITIFVCLVTLLSTFFIIILEETRTIGILKAMGMKNSNISYIFLWMAGRIIIKGLLAGNFIALTFAFIQHKYHLIKLDAATYYVPYIPIDISVGAVLIINIAVFILCLAALLIPGRIIAKHVSPVEAIRFE